MKKITLFTCLFAAVLLCGTGFGCSEDHQTPPPLNSDMLSVSPTEVVLGAEADASATFVITTAAAWSAEITGTGFTLDPASGTGNATVTVTATAANSTAEPQELGSITVTVPSINATQTVAVSQAAAEEEAWTPLPGALEGYPRGLSVVPFTQDLDDGAKCSGYYAVVDFAVNPKLSFRPQFTTNGEVPTKYFADFKASGEGTPYLATNAGYWATRSSSVSLLIDQGQLLSTSATIVQFYEDPKDTNSTLYTCYPTRAALGQMADGSFEATWIYCMTSSLNAPYSFPQPLDNDEQTHTFLPDPPTPQTPGAVKWAPEEAVGGGPMLVYDGANVAVENYWKEVLDNGGTMGMSRVPRTAYGYTADGKLVLMVCDGRGANGSAGYTISEEADKMIELGCTYAINLDGGGSSTIVGKEGTCLNLPSDKDPATGEMGVERAIPTAVVIAEE